MLSHQVLLAQLVDLGVTVDTVETTAVSLTQLAVSTLAAPGPPALASLVLSVLSRATKSPTLAPATSQLSTAAPSHQVLLAQLVDLVATATEDTADTVLHPPLHHPLALSVASSRLALLLPSLAASLLPQAVSHPAASLRAVRRSLLGLSLASQAG